MYRGRIERDFDIWVSKGIIDSRAAGAMLAEYDGRETSFTAGRVLATLAAVLVAAALLLLVAANWEEIPRTARLVGIIALLWAFLLAAGFALLRSRRIVGGSLLVMGTMTFGGAIALIGQMYHMSGDMVDALMVWLAVACASALAFRSAPVAIAASILAWWMFGELAIDNFGTLEGNGYIYAVPFVFLVVLFLGRYTQATIARHLAYLLALGWCGWFYFELPELWVAALFAGVGAIVFLATTLSLSPVHRFVEDARAAPAFYAFSLALMGLWMMHMEVDGTAAEAAVGAVTFAVALGGIAMVGRDNGAVRFLGYLAFAGELLYLAFETIGTMLGTSGFFLISGILVGLAAWLIVRWERRIAKITTEGV